MTRRVTILCNVTEATKLCQKINKTKVAFTLVLLLLSFELVHVYGCCACSCNDCDSNCLDYLSRGHTTTGVYHVTPSRSRTGYDVYCDMTTDGGGWLVFQRRLDGSIDFFKNWTEYEKGFGHPSGEYWLGLRPLKRILSQGFYELRIDMTDFEGNAAYAQYDDFDIGDFNENYKLKVTSYTGTAGDSLSEHHGSMFSTRDRDNDIDTDVFCATHNKGAWWYFNCHWSNLNGQYLNGSHVSNLGAGVNWYHWKRHNYSLQTTDMKIRPT